MTPISTNEKWGRENFSFLEKNAQSALRHFAGDKKYGPACNFSLISRELTAFTRVTFQGTRCGT